MRRTIVAAALVGAAVLGAAGCDTTTTTTTPIGQAPAAADDGGGADDPAADDSAGDPPSDPPVSEQLRDLDVAAGKAGGSKAAYAQAFKTLSARCKEQGVGLGNEVGAALKILTKAGIHDENRLTLMRNIAASIPKGQKMSCAEVGGAYVTLREGN